MDRQTVIDLSENVPARAYRNENGRHESPEKVRKAANIYGMQNIKKIVIKLKEMQDIILECKRLTLMGDVLVHVAERTF